MTYQDAKDAADRLNRDPKVTAKVVRILPPDLDPIQEGDTGWDVEITVLEDW